MSDTFEHVILEVRDRVAVITLNRPERLNAFNSRLSHELEQALDATDQDDGVRAVVVTGAGRAFSSGADLAAGGDTFDRNQRGEDPHAIPSDRAAAARRIIRSYYSLKPVIAAVNGPAMGVGATITLPMDIRLASSEAKFGFVFTRRGIVPEAGSTWFLPRLVGVSTAVEWCVAGRTVLAEEALARGLVRSVHPPEDLLPAAISLAREIAEAAPVSVALARQMLWRGLSYSDPLQALDVERRAMRARGAARDVREGISAFLERRMPEFADGVSGDLPDVFSASS